MKVLKISKSVLGEEHPDAGTPIAPNYSVSKRRLCSEYGVISRGLNFVEGPNNEKFDVSQNQC